MEAIDWDVYAKSYEDTQHLIGRPDLAQKHFELIGREQGRDAGFDSLLVYCTVPEVESQYTAKQHYLQMPVPTRVRSRQSLIAEVKVHPELIHMLPEGSNYLIEPAVDSAIFQMNLQQERLALSVLIDQIVQEVINELVSEAASSPLHALPKSEGLAARAVQQRPGMVRVKQRAPCLIEADLLIPVLDGKAYLVSGYCFDPENQLVELALWSGNKSVNFLPALKRVVRQDCYEQLLARGVPPALLEQDVGFAALIPSDLFEQPPHQVVCQFADGETQTFTPKSLSVEDVSAANLQAVWRALFNEILKYAGTDIDSIDAQILAAVVQQQQVAGYHFALAAEEVSSVERSTFIRLSMDDPDAHLKSVYFRTPSGRHIHLTERMVMQLDKGTAGAAARNATGPSFYTVFLDNLYLAPNTSIDFYALMEDGQWCHTAHTVTLGTAEKLRDHLLKIWNPKLKDHSRQVLERLIEPAYPVLFSAKPGQQKRPLQCLQFGTPERNPEVSVIVNLRKGTHTLRNLLACFASNPVHMKFELILAIDQIDRVSEIEQTLQDYHAIFGVPCHLYGALESIGSAELLTRATEQARGEVVLHLAGNIIPKSLGDLKLLADAAKATDKGLLAPAILNADGSIFECGLGFSRSNFNNQLWLQDSPWQGFSIDMLNLPERMESPAVSAHCFAISKKYFLGLGGFEASYAVDGFEDIDFSLKVWESGYTVEAIPGAQVVLLPKPFVANRIDPDLDIKIKLANSKQLNRKWSALINSKFANWQHGSSGLKTQLDLQHTLQSLIG